MKGECEGEQGECEGERGECEGLKAASWWVRGKVRSGRILLPLCAKTDRGQLSPTGSGMQRN
jgi:hypothetical protein